LGVLVNVLATARDRKVSTAFVLRFKYLQI